MSVLASRADGDMLAVDPLGAATPVLWNGGVAWQDIGGVRAVTPGAPPRRLVSFRPLGFTYAYSLDSGTGSGGGPGYLAYGWEEANDMTPPMGPGDTRVPPPPLPYETSIVHRGVLAPDGHITQLPGCGAEDEPTAFGTFLVSLAGTSAANATVGYLCAGAPPGMQAPAGTVLPSYLALSALATLAGPPQTIAEAGGALQLSGNYVAYDATSALGAGQIVVAARDTHAVSYRLPYSADQQVHALALQADGTLVVLGVGTSACPHPAIGAGQSYPAEWLSPASPTPHQLGCFYDGVLRPVGGQWVALAPGPGAQASLELVTLAGAPPRTLAVFPNAGMFEPQIQQPLFQSHIEPGADFDGHRLAWVQQTCAGAAIELMPDVAAMSPSATPLSARCPVRLRVHGPLRPTRGGVVRVRLACPLGCTVTELRIVGAHGLSVQASTYFSLPASATAVTRSLRLPRRARADLRRRGRVRAVLSVITAGLGSAPATKSSARVTLAR